MAKYYKFKYSAGFSGTETDKVIKFSDDITETEVQEAFDDWYAEQRRDYGDFEEISEEEAASLGVYGDCSGN